MSKMRPCSDTGDHEYQTIMRSGVAKIGEYAKRLPGIGESGHPLIVARTRALATS